MNSKMNIVLKTAKQLTKEYPEGWTGGNCDLVAASSSVSSELTTSDVRSILEYYSGTTLHAEDLTFISIEKVETIRS